MCTFLIYFATTAEQMDKYFLIALRPFKFLFHCSFIYSLNFKRPSFRKSADQRVCTLNCYKAAYRIILCSMKRNVLLRTAR